MQKILSKPWVLILIALSFSILVRMVWVVQFSEISSVRFNDAFMINTNDGYYWAEGARDILNDSYLEGSKSPVNSATSIVTAFLAKILPISFENLIFYMPAFFGSLIVLPIILIGARLGQLHAAFIASLLAAITVSYYNRTMVGYYDTDMLNIVLPLFMVWSLILAFLSQEKSYILFTGLEIVAYRWWYPQSYALEFAFFGLVLIYVLFKERNNPYFFQLLSMMLIAMMGLPDLVRLVGVLVLYGIFLYTNKYTKTLLLFALLAFMLTGGLMPILEKLQGYVFKTPTFVLEDEIPLHFFSVMQTIREASNIPFDVFAARISGHWSSFIVSMIGYILLLKRYRIMFLSLPMLGLGFLAYVGGLRFTIYAVPIAALGMGYFIVLAGEFFKQKIFSQRNSSFLYGAWIFVASIIALYPNLTHIVNYKVPTVLNSSEVAQLDAFSKVSKPADYTIAWWDYGYPLRYYAKTQTLIDGGQHSGAENFPVSFIFFQDQLKAAAMARFAVSYEAKRRAIKWKERQLSEDERTKLPSSNMSWMIQESGFSDSKEFLSALPRLKKPEFDANIYLYLPFRMIPIMHTISRFSALNLMDGSPKKSPFFLFTQRIQEDKDILKFASNITINKSSGKVTLGNQEAMLKALVTVWYDGDGKLHKSYKLINKDGKLNLIYMQSYKGFVLVDDLMYASTFVQLFVLEEYDDELFSPISLTPWAKIYQIKK